MVSEWDNFWENKIWTRDVGRQHFYWRNKRNFFDLNRTFKIRRIEAIWSKFRLDKKTSVSKNADGTLVKILFSQTMQNLTYWVR